MDFSALLSATLVILLVLDPFGNLPILAAMLRQVEPSRRAAVLWRECAVAFGVLVAFLFSGKALLRMMQLSTEALSVAGGVVLLLIALKMLFGTESSATHNTTLDREPFIVPIAVPLIAGPSAMATVILMASRQPEKIATWFTAVCIAMAVTTLVLVQTARLERLLGPRGLAALEKLMALLLSALAVEMLLAGLKRYFLGS